MKNQYSNKRLGNTKEISIDGNVWLIDNKYDKNVYDKALKHINKCFINRDYKSASEIISFLRIPTNYTKSNKNKVLFYYYQGKLLFENHDYYKSILYMDSISMTLPLNSVKIDTMLALSYNIRGCCYLKLRKGDEAKSSFVISLQYLSEYKKNDVSILMADCYNNLFIVNGRSWSESEIEDYVKKMEKYYNKSGHSLKMRLAQIYYNVGTLYMINKNIEKAIKYFKRSEELYLTFNGQSDIKLGGVYNGIGTALMKLYEYSKSLLYFKKAYQIYKRIYGNKSLVTIKILSNIAICNQFLDNHDDAIKVFHMVLKAPINKNMEARISKNVGDCLFDKGDIDSSFYYYRKAIDLYQESNKNPYFLCLTYNKYANCLNSENRCKEALAIIQEALKVYDENHLNYPVEKAAFYNTASIAYLRLNDLNNANKHLMLASNTLVVQNINAKSGEGEFTVIDKGNLLDVKINQAIYMRACYLKDTTAIGYLEEETNIYYSCIDLIKDLFQILSYESKLLLLNKSHIVYSKIVELSYILFNLSKDDKYIHKAFEAIERDKSSLLLSDLYRDEANANGLLPNEIVNYEKRLEKKIGYYTKLVYDEKKQFVKSNNKLSGYENLLLRYQQSYDSLLSEIKEKYPLYNKLRGNVSVIDLQKVQSQLNKDEVVLEFLEYSNRLFIVCISKDDISFKSTIYDDDSKNDIRDLISLSSKFSLTNTSNNTSIDNYANLSSKIYCKLIKPFEEDIRSKKIYIIPDGILNYLPFEILNTEEGKFDNFKNIPYLFESHLISYSYSSTLLFMERQKCINNGEVISFAPSYGNDTIDGNNLTPLKYTNRELDYLNANFEGKYFRGNDATEHNFKEFSNEYKLIHLAMHAVVDEDMALYSKLIFNKENDKIEDGLLNIFELINLDLNAEMVVLSACNTGTGQYTRGEGVISLARGFLYSGVPNIIMTLWEVNDKSSSEIMKLFYKYMKEGHGQVEALRLAKFRYLENSNNLKAHPAFWSAYVNVGKFKQVSIKTANSNYYLGFGIFVILMLFFLIIIKKLI
ncbi:MAG: CHAT domain-containing protein [Hyphomicrobiales bacterium]